MSMIDKMKQNMNSVNTENLDVDDSFDASNEEALEQTIFPDEYDAIAFSCAIESALDDPSDDYIDEGENELEDGIIDTDGLSDDDLDADDDELNIDDFDVNGDDVSDECTLESLVRDLTEGDLALDSVITDNMEDDTDTPENEDDDPDLDIDDLSDPDSGEDDDDYNLDDDMDSCTEALKDMLSEMDD